MTEWQTTVVDMDAEMKGLGMWLITKTFVWIAALRRTLVHWQANVQTVAAISAHGALASVMIDAPRIIHNAREERVVPQIRRILYARSRRWQAEAWVALLASVVSVASYIYYAQLGLTLAYTDSISHIMIARRVFAGSAPGLAQLGADWLPLTHMLMLPLVWNDTLFRDGFAGTFPSMVAYVVSAVYMYRLAALVFSSQLAGWAAVLTLMLNPSVLYMQSTPMSELDFICFAVIAVYYAVRWVRTFNANDLVKCALATVAGTLVRYDGWALALALLVIVVIVAWRLRGRLIAESHTLLFGMLGLAGCAAWITYQMVIFKNPLYFLNGPYSAHTQQQTIESSAGLPTEHNVLLSLNIYAHATLDTLTWPIVAAALLGLFWFIYRTRLHISTWPVYLLLVPLVFNWLSLVLGMTIIETPEVPLNGSATFFNGRYGMMMIPAAALFVAYLVTLRRKLAPIVLGLIVVASTILIAGGTPYALQDPLHGVSMQERVLMSQGGRWLASNYHSGAVLVSDGPFSGLIYDSGLPDRVFLSEGDGASFRTALTHPEAAATWIIMTPDGGNYDPVWTALHNRTDWRQFYVLRQVFGTTQIYERNDMAYSSATLALATHPPAMRSNPYNLPRPMFSRLFPLYNLGDTKQANRWTKQMTYIMNGGR